MPYLLFPYSPLEENCDSTLLHHLQGFHNFFRRRVTGFHRHITTSRHFKCVIQKWVTPMDILAHFIPSGIHFSSHQKCVEYVAFKGTREEKTFWTELLWKKFLLQMVKHANTAGVIILTASQFAWCLVLNKTLTCTTCCGCRLAEMAQTNSVLKLLNHITPLELK